MFRKQKTHAVAVYDVRPKPEDHNQFDPYFIALCDCKWVGNSYDNSDDAFADAESHDANVSPTIQRTLG